jgi:ABC-type multidrug transport system fused ATPase/permease subunit
MKSTWLNYLKQGLSQELPPSDQIAGQAKPADPQAAIRALLPFMRPHWRTGLLGALLILFSTLLAFPQPLIYRFLVDDVILARQLNLLPWAILLFAGIKILAMGTELWQDYFLHNFEQAVILDIQKDLLDHTLRLPKAFFDKKEIGYLISRISSDVGGLQWFFSGTVVYLISSLLQFIGGLAFLFYLEWRLALACTILLPILVVSNRYFSTRLRTLSHRNMEQRAAILQHLQETIASIPLIKAFSSESRESQRVGQTFEGGRQISMEQNVVSSVAALAIKVIPDLARAIVLIAGAYLAIQGEWTLGSLLAFSSFLGYVLSPAMYLANANLSLQNALASLERVMGLFDIVPEENLNTGILPDQLQGHIEFKGVSFAYGVEDAVLENISFTIQPGERVAIVGPSGVGKTTLVSLILCFYKPTAGEIYFDGTPLSDYNLPALRRRIGYVSQSSLLLSGTFDENLRYGNPEARQEDVEKAAKAAGIHDFIIQLPQGYDSKIDERAVNLSEGQKQRLSIARALIKSPDILILDEPTAALDSIVERSIFAALPRFIQGKTLFVVAHRLATIQDSDRILLLNEKELVAMGTHAQLLAENAFYRELVSNQQVSG